MLIERYGDHKGIDFERLYKFMTEAHSKTGRDSVLAMRQRNDIIPRREMSQEEIDEDLMWRIESLLVQSKAFVDIADLREAFQKKDASKTGKVSSMIVSIWMSLNIQ
ncbi:hypothetical protein CHS0354_011798 [Potamilus streckersoni]|uniref:Uncharacterized protein n=1 Tax=Potamilus streckersoni TaxID=2493646 RepID=A0AAE0THB2_9BIVA|nr:hypothetical protein CHS0354_011798 [Potamilus streckersoni]